MSEEQLTKKQRREQRRLEKLAQREAEANAEKRKKLMRYTIVGVIVVGVVGAYIAIKVFTPDASEVTADENTVDPYKGPEDAPIVIQEFGDFECPACAAAAPIMTDLLEANDDIKLVFNDFPLESIHKHARYASQVGECAYTTGGNEVFWPLHDLLYEKQSEWSSQSVSAAKDTILGLVEEVGADKATIESCADESATKAAVRGDQAEGTRLRVSSTPSFFINDQRVVGVKSLEDWQEIVDRVRDDLPEVEQESGEEESEEELTDTEVEE